MAEPAAVPTPPALIAWLAGDRAGLEEASPTLARRGFSGLWCADAPALFALARREALDAIVADLEGLEQNAVALVRAVRRTPGRRGLPLLLLAPASASDEASAAIRVGADDCLTKPVPPDLLAERVAAMVRTARQFSRPEPWGRDLLKTRDGRLILDLKGFRCQVQEGLEYQEKRLTRKQFHVLAVLLRRPNRVVRWQDFFRQGWRPNKLRQDSRTLVQHVMRLRQILGPLGAQLETVAGVGYRWND